MLDATRYQQPSSAAVQKLYEIEGSASRVVVVVVVVQCRLRRTGLCSARSTRGWRSRRRRDGSMTPGASTIWCSTLAIRDSKSFLTDRCCPAADAAEYLRAGRKHEFARCSDYEKLLYCIVRGATRGSVSNARRRYWLLILVYGRNGDHMSVTVLTR